MALLRWIGVSAVVTVRAHRACSLARLAPGLQRPSMGEGTRRQAARAPGSMRLLLQPGRLAQFVGPVGLLPRERGGGLLLAGAVGVADLLGLAAEVTVAGGARSEEHTSELQSLMRISYAVFCLKKKTQT